MLALKAASKFSLGRLLAVALLPLCAASAQAGEELARHEQTAAFAVKPYQAIMLDAGAKQIGGYFSENQGQCKLSVIVADAWREDREPAPSLRVQMMVGVDKPAHLDTGDGKTVRFECKKDGLAMNAVVLDRYAAK